MLIRYSNIIIVQQSKKNQLKTLFEMNSNYSSLFLVAAANKVFLLEIHAEEDHEFADFISAT